MDKVGLTCRRLVGGRAVDKAVRGCGGREWMWVLDVGKTGRGSMIGRISLALSTKMASPSISSSAAVTISACRRRPRQTAPQCTPMDNKAERRSCVERPVSARQLFVTHCLVRLESQNVHNRGVNIELCKHH